MKKILYVLAAIAILIVILKITNDTKAEQIQETNKDNLLIVDEKYNKKTKVSYESESSFTATNNYIYLTVTDSYSESIGSKVVQINRKTGENKEIFKTRHAEAATQSLSSDGKWITWIDDYISGGEAEIYAMNEETGKIIKLGSTDKHVKKSDAQISGNAIVWTEYDEKTEVRTLQFYNTENGKTETISTRNYVTLFNEKISIRKDQIVFSDKVNNQFVLKLYNIKNKEMKTIKLTEKEIGSTEFIEDEKVIYTQYRSLDDTSNNQIMMYDVAMQKETLILQPKKNTEYYYQGALMGDHTFLIETDEDHIFYKLVGGKFKEIPTFNAEKYYPDFAIIDFSNGNYFIAGGENDDGEYVTLTVTDKFKWMK